MDILQKIVQWNKARGLLELPFNHQKEASFILEELLESTGQYDSVSAREQAMFLATEIIAVPNDNKEQVIDAWADIIVFATGAIAKCGYDPSKVMDEVFKEIDSRTGKMVEGKFVKDVDVKLYVADFSVCKFFETD